VPTGKAIEESVDLAHEIYNRYSVEFHNRSLNTGCRFQGATMTEPVMDNGAPSLSAEPATNSGAQSQSTGLVKNEEEQPSQEKL
jgi:hypothetical protein